MYKKHYLGYYNIFFLLNLEVFPFFLRKYILVTCIDFISYKNDSCVFSKKNCSEY